MKTQFRNRTEAGELLAGKLKQYANRTDVLVLALPRGGVPGATHLFEEPGALAQVASLAAGWFQRYLKSRLHQA
jgi:predicted phosphoribosyltransferase